MTAGRAALVGLVDRYLRDLLDSFVTLLAVHNIPYFMQAAGEPLKLKFARGPYGPQAENLPHVLNAMEGYLISGYADGGDAPDKQLKLARDDRHRERRHPVVPALRGRRGVPALADGCGLRADVRGTRGAGRVKGEIVDRGLLIVD